MDKYGLIGYPLGHSFSKNYFNEKFENEGIDATYINFEIPTIEDLTEVLDSNPELKGFNVTIPYKEKVISYLDYVSPEANASPKPYNRLSILSTKKPLFLVRVVLPRPSAMD